ncbi:MAG: hypothetical protein KGJ77_07370 [Acidobacteriota bacterium]|nr:hypothetical protein [Acidobacteriota bacterium]
MFDDDECGGRQAVAVGAGDGWRCQSNWRLPISKMTGADRRALVPCSAVAVVRFLLGVVVVGAALLWIIAATHGFSGAYCFQSSGSCSSTSNVTIQWDTVLWVGPVVFVIALAFLFILRRPR